MFVFHTTYPKKLYKIAWSCIILQYGSQFYGRDCLPQCALNSHLRHPITLDFCFRGKIVHNPIMNALKNSFEVERQNCQILQNQSHIFWSSTKPDPFFIIARLSPSGLEIALKAGENKARRVNL